MPQKGEPHSMKATRGPSELAAVAVENHFGRYRGSQSIASQPEDHRAYLASVEWLRWCLTESELLSPTGRERFYIAVTEGFRPDGYGDEEFGDDAFEVLVQFARYYSTWRITPRVLKLVRGHAFALSIDPIEGLNLARAVTDECRSRYAPHVPRLNRPPEIIAPPLRRAEAAAFALSYWHARYRAEACENAETPDTERMVLSVESMASGDRKTFMHDLREGLLLAAPSGRRATAAARRRYRRNRALALAVALDEHRASNLGFEGVVAERAERLARETGSTVRKAFRFLYYLARHSRGT